MSYHDRWITCTDDGISVRAYYFPWGTKHIPYGSIRAVRRVPLAAARGRARIWGTANPGYWASLDPNRPNKHTALILDIGRRVKPFLTPEDPDAMLDEIRAHTGISDISDDDRGPVL